MGQSRFGSRGPKYSGNLLYIFSSMLEEIVYILIESQIIILI